MIIKDRQTKGNKRLLNLRSLGPSPRPVLPLLRWHHIEIPAWGGVGFGEGSCPGGFIFPIYALPHLCAAALGFFLQSEYILLFPSSVFLLLLFPVLEKNALVPPTSSFRSQICLQNPLHVKPSSMNLLCLLQLAVIHRNHKV